MYELSLFTGAGGGVLGTKLLGFSHIGYVEHEKYCQKIIKQRIEDGILDAAPVYGDIRAFIREGFAGAYSGLVDVLTAGFPCQPFSVAGKRQGDDDERNMWPETIECIRIIRPRYAFLENVPGLLVHKYIGRIFGDLAEAGYNARWCVLGADDCGAPHRRKRLWILAKSRCERLSGTNKRVQSKGKEPERKESELLCKGESGNVAHTNQSSRSPKYGIKQETRAKKPAGSSKTGKSDLAHANSPQRKRRSISRRIQQKNTIFNSRNTNTWWAEDPAERATEPRLGRVAHGVAHRVDRLKALGNGQVPIVAATAWNLLIQGLED